MAPRDHHFIFAKQFLSKQTFQSPDTVFKELSGPMRDGFLMYLWEQVGEVVDEKLLASDVGTKAAIGSPAVHTLSVLGVDQRGGWELILINMPPTVSSNEALYIALARKGGEVRYFTFEHTMEAGICTLREIVPDGGMNYGFFEGDISPDAFLRGLGGVLGFDTDDADVGATDAPAQPIPSSGAGPKKQSKVAKGCMGCAVLLIGGFLLLFTSAGYLFYIEETALDDHSDQIIGPIPVKVGEPFEATYDWSGTGYAHHDFWIAVDGSAEVELNGQFGCARGSSKIDPRSFQASTSDRWLTTNQTGSGAWLRIGDEYDRSGVDPRHCVGVITQASGEIKSMHLIMTRSQRPSDWAAF